MKPARLRPQAKQDLSDEAHYYAVEGGMRLGYEFEEAAVEALGEIERMPGLGSPRLGIELEMHGLRAWRTGKFPLSWFYFERHDHLDVAAVVAQAEWSTTNPAAARRGGTSRRKPSSIASMPCCTTRCTARNMRRT